MQEILRSVERLALSPSPVLILGETGTGKEIVARAIHQSGAAARPLVTIDCSALVGALMESELFGHVRGAFTGAVSNKIGLLEMADGGTAFFDEIGELPLNLQMKLLRVIQEKEVRPVGSLLPHRANFRIVAATNRNLAAEVQHGSFRRDLFYRLNVVVLRLPPLRERAGDIPALVAHFLARHGGRYSLTADAMDAILSYEWPGNVRELENCIERMVAMNSGPLLGVSDLPTNLQYGLSAKKAAALALKAAAGQSSEPLPLHVPPVPLALPVLSLGEAEKQAILKALDYTRGDRAHAAQLLGIGRTTLYRKLKEYGL
jgi:transcriptional regulator with GAF, ATPase, and Fis domain